MIASEFPIAQLKSELFKALAHPARVRVLEQLVMGERSVGDLAETLEIEISHLSQQLGVLRRAGVVITRRVGTTVFYSLRDPRMSQLLAVGRQMLVSNLESSRDLLSTLEDTATPEDVVADQLVSARHDSDADL
ncbi:MAG: ArsR/SmtB family transcription factor [Lacisediminihabitans sp.]